MQRRREFFAAAGAMLATATMGNAFAQRPASGRVCTGFPAGSSADSVARLLATKLSTAGTPYIVDNRTGAGGRMAPENIRNSPPDGLSMLMVPDSVMVLFPSVYKSLAYDPVRDFRPVTTLCSVPLGLVVGPMVPLAVKNMSDFAQWCRANPQQASFGTSGAGSTLHFTGVMFARAAQIEFQHIPYRGANLAAQDAAAGQIASCMGVLSAGWPLIQAGKLRVLGVSSPARSRFLPDVPTFGEQGFKELEIVTWYGSFLPAKTPDARLAEVHAATVAAFRQQDVVDALAGMAMEPMTMPSPEFSNLLKSDIARWAGVVKQLKYVAED